MSKKTNKELKIAVESIRIAIISMAIAFALSIIPLSISILREEWKIPMTIIIILVYCVFAAILMYIASKIKMPSSINSS